MRIKPNNWSALTPEQKREVRLSWLIKDAEEIQFVSPEAKKRYLTKTSRMIKAYSVDKPDRVPVSLGFGLTAMSMYGVDDYTAIN